MANCAIGLNGLLIVSRREWSLLLFSIIDLCATFRASIEVRGGGGSALTVCQVWHMVAMLRMWLRGAKDLKFMRSNRSFPCICIQISNRLRKLIGFCYCWSFVASLALFAFAVFLVLSAYYFIIAMDRLSYSNTQYLHSTAVAAESSGRIYEYHIFYRF